MRLLSRTALTGRINKKPTEAFLQAAVGLDRTCKQACKYGPRLKNEPQSRSIWRNALGDYGDSTGGVNGFGQEVFAMSGTPTPPPGYKAVFCMTFKHWRSGKDVRRKDGRPFCFFVKQ